MTTAKAYAALVGSIATGLLGVFTGDTTLGQALTVVAVIATAFATYRIPNADAPRRRRVTRNDTARADLLYVLWCVVLALAAIALLVWLA